MFKRILILALGILIVQSAFAAEQTYKVDAAKSKLEWLGKKVTGEHHGTINIKSGSLHFTDGKFDGGEFEIDMKSIINLDLEDETWNAKLVNHLKSDDFFSVESYPVSILKIKEVKNYKDENSDANYWVIADLTIKGITNPVEFTAKLENQGDIVTGVANINVDRSKYNVKYGSGSFFKGLGDKMIYDDFHMKVNLNAVK